MNLQSGSCEVPVPSRESTTHAFLMRTAELLHRYGTPSHRLERVMTKVAHTLGVPSVFLYTPTALVVSLGAGHTEKTYMRRVDSGSVDVDKLIRFDETLEQLTAGLITIDQADEQMANIASSKPPYGFLLTTIACGLACGSVAVFLGGSVRELLWASVFGFCIAMLEAAHERLRWERGLLEPVAGFFAALGSLAVAKHLYPLDDRLVTLAALVVLLPGLSLTIALTELAVGHLSAGVARLAGALAILLTLVLGVGLAWRVGANWRLLPDSPDRLPAWADGLALLVAPFAFAILFRAGWRQWPIIFVVSWSGFLTTRYCGRAWGPEIGSFLGALVVGCGSNLYARYRNRPALVTLTPGMLILVPGVIGYRSLTAMLDRQTIQGIDEAFAMVLIAMSLVGGLLASGALVPPKRIL